MRHPPKILYNGKLYILADTPEAAENINKELSFLKTENILLKQEINSWKNSRSFTGEMPVDGREKRRK